jgi:hypothetical protein
MTQRTRYFLVGSGLIVVVGLCTGLVAYYGGNLPFSSSTRGPAELAYVPADSAAVAYADVRHIMDSEFRQRLRALLPTGQEKDRMLAETGIDIERDIDSVVAGLGASDAAGGQGHRVVLVRGRFQPDRIEALARAHGAAVEDYRGTRLVIEPARKAADDDRTPADRAAVRGGLAFLEPTLLALGDVDGIKRAVDAGMTRAGMSGDAAMMKFVSGVNTGDAWIVGRFDALAQNTGLAPAMRNQLSSVRWFSLSADVDQSINCRLHAEAENEQSAEQVRSVVNGMLAAAKLMSNQDARLNTVLGSVQSSGVGPDIELSFTVPAELLDMVANAAHGATGVPR